MKRLLLCVLSLVVSIVPAHGSTITFAGFDSGAGFGVAHPGSDAAQASFATAAGALGTIQLITFESLAVGPINNGVAFSLSPDVTVAFNNTSGFFSSGTGIRNSSNNSQGFNITSGGSLFMQVTPRGVGNVTAVFNFDGAGISAFGAYLTGTESSLDGTFSVTFNDGSVQNIGIAKNALAGAQFFGFTDAGKSIASLTITEAGPFVSSQDFWGLDNLQFVATVPEPSTLWLVALGIPVVLVRMRRKGH